MNAGGANVVVFASPLAIGQEWSQVGNDGHALHPDSPAASPLSVGPGITIVPVPSLHPEDVLSRTPKRSISSSVKTSGWTGPTLPASAGTAPTFRIRGRFGIICPVPTKALRRVVIEGRTL